MSRLPIRTIDDAPEIAKPGLAAAQKNNGFLPNLVRLLANAPIALEAYQTLSAINARGELSPAEREAVQITAAAVHGCGFCVAGHTAVVYIKIGLSENIVNALRNGDCVPDARLDTVEAARRARKSVLAQPRWGPLRVYK
jgi:AhpD family alkylhydroperoxidase